MSERRAAAFDAVATARRVLDVESRAVTEMGQRLGADFVRAVEMITACQGRVVVTGMGKSGQICRKIVATMSSTGTAALFLHAAEGAHGDLGMFARGDVAVAVSNSGTTEEVLLLLPAIKRLGLPLISITGGMDSPLARAGDAVLDVSVREEACPMGLAPTASTTCTLAMGDALAVAVLEAKGFTERDFALLHPGGALGRRLLRVNEIMHHDVGVPTVSRAMAMPEVLAAMTSGGLGVVGVVDDEGRLAGIITDGDLRRALMRRTSLDGASAGDVMTASPKTVDAEALAAEALAAMERHSITSLFIVEDGRPRGIIHLHDLLKAGVA